MTAPLADATSTEEDQIDDETNLDDASGDTGDAGSATSDDTTEDLDGAEELGDAGKKALDAMKTKWRQERARAKAAEDKLAAASKPKVDETDLDAVREQVRAEARAENLRERVLDKIEAKAAGKFKDPEDALLRLGKNVDEYISEGRIDLEAIEDALSELLEKRPDFGVTQGEPKRFKGSADGGPKASAGKPQLTQADLDRLDKEGKFAEINEARESGRLNKLLGITA